MNVPASIFRENDIRGTYPEQINESTIKLIAYAIARKCKKHGISSIAGWKRWASFRPFIT
jgi:phosphomannomutase